MLWVMSPGEAAQWTAGEVMCVLLLVGFTRQVCHKFMVEDTFMLFVQ